MNLRSWLKAVRYSLVFSTLYLLVMLVLALPTIPNLRWQMPDLVPGYGFVPQEEYIVTPTSSSVLPATSLATEVQRRLADTSVGISYYTVTVQGNTVKVLVQQDQASTTTRSLLSAQGKAYFAISNNRLDQVDQQKDILYFYTASNYTQSIVDSSDITAVQVRRDTSTDQAQDFFVIHLTEEGFKRFQGLNTDQNANKVLGLWIDNQVLPMGAISASFFSSYTNNTLSVPLIFGLANSKYLISVLQGPTLPSTVSVVGPNAVQPWFDFRSTWLVLIGVVALSVLIMFGLSFRRGQQGYLVLLGSFAIFNIPLATIVMAKLLQRPVSVYTMAGMIGMILIILSLVGTMMWIDSLKKLRHKQKQWKWFTQQTSQMALFLLLIPTAILLFTSNPFAYLASELGWQVSILIVTWWWLQWLHHNDYEKPTT